MARMARFYGWTDDEMFRTHWRRFFSYARRMVKLQAEEDLQQLMLMRASQSEKEGFMSMVNDLQRRMGIKKKQPGRRRPAGSLATSLASEVRGDRLLADAVRVVEPGSLRAEIEAKRKALGG